MFNNIPKVTYKYVIKQNTTTGLCKIIKLKMQGDKALSKSTTQYRRISKIDAEDILHKIERGIIKI